MHQCADRVLFTKHSMGTKNMQACSNPSRQGCPWSTPKATLVLTKGSFDTSLGVNLVSWSSLEKKGLVLIIQILKNLHTKCKKGITCGGCKPVGRPWQSGQQGLGLLLHSAASAPCFHRHTSPGPKQARTVCTDSFSFFPPNETQYS